MKRIYFILLTVCFAFVSIFSAFGVIKKIQSTTGSKITSRRTVVIDAGHGGKDGGTIGIDLAQEKEINLSIALMLRDYLMVSGIHTVMTREDDTELYPEGSDTSRSDLYNRLDFVNAQQNGVLISIHQNHFSDEREWGTQVWYSANTPESKVLADRILSNVKLWLQPDNQRENKVSDSSYYILYKASVPSVMVECGFMSNAEENSKLQNQEYQNQFAFIILTGVCGEV